MERRKFIAGLGSLTAAGAAGIGTGAFSSVSASRGMTVEAAGDMSAFLKLEATSGYASNTGDTLEVNLSDEASGATGSGLNKGTTTILDVFNIANQGTEPVAIHFNEDPPISINTEGVEVSQWFISPQDKTDPSSGLEEAATWPDDQPPNLDDDDETGRSSIDLAQFDSPSDYPNILGQGDDVSVGLFIKITDPSKVDIDGTLEVFAYSKQSAEDAQS